MFRIAMFIIISFLIVVSAGTSSFGQHYYSANQQQPLNTDTTKLMVLFSDGYVFDASQFVDYYSEIDSQIYHQIEYDDFKFFAVTTENYYDFIDVLLNDSRVAHVNPYYLTNTNTPMPAGRTICCKFLDNVDIDFIDSLNEVYHVEIIYERDYTFNQFLLQVKKDAALSTLEIANIYYNVEETEFSHPNFLGGYDFHNYDIRDYYWDNQWAMHRIFEVEPGISYRHKAFEITIGDSNLVIAVLDQGINPHEDLPVNRLYMGYDFEAMDNDPTPCDWRGWGWHGMGVTGIIGASHNRDSALISDNNTGIYGLAPDCKIMPLKIGSGIWVVPPGQELEFEHCRGNFAAHERIAGAIAYAWALGAEIISCSWGGELRVDVVETELHQASIAGRDGKGCGIFYSSGNWTYDTPIYPAALPEVMSVGAMHPDDSIWEYSGYYKVDIVAPSGRSLDMPILTLDQMDTLGYNYIGHACLDPGDLDYNCFFGGTSAAQPVVAGVAALVLSKYPELTREELYEALKCSADRNLYDTITEPPDQKYGYGMVRPLEALLTVSRGDVNGISGINLFDVTYLLSYLYKTGPEPTPDFRMGDANCDGIINLFDVTYMISWLYHGGPKQPVPCCEFDY